MRRTDHDRLIMTQLLIFTSKIQSTQWMLFKKLIELILSRLRLLGSCHIVNLYYFNYDFINTEWIPHCFVVVGTMLIELERIEGY